MRQIWFAILAIAGFVSLYPFNFQTASLDAATIRTFLSTCCQLTNRGDILGNFILFAPVGFAGVLAQTEQQWLPRRMVRVLLISVFYALMLQVLQLYLPSRDESLQDVLWNSIGALAGATLAPLASKHSRREAGLASGAALIPVVLLGAWLAYRLFPFVPSLDLQLWKDSLKPLFALDVRPASLVRDTTAWAVAGYLMKRTLEGATPDRYLLPLGLGVLSLEVVIVANTISAASLLGLFLGVGIWSAFLRKLAKPEAWLLAALALSVLTSGLTPLAFRSVPADFGWIPFHGFLGGSMYLNTHSALEKLFLYASFLYLCRQLQLTFGFAALLGASAIGLIEILQTRMIGHTAEITDPLLVVLAALGMRTLEKTESTAPHGAAPRSMERSAGSDTQCEPVRLRSWQFEFLQQMATESGLSPAETACRILDYMTEHATRGPLELPDGTRRRRSTGVEKPNTPADAWPGRDRWITLKIPLCEAHDSLVTKLSNECAISRSRAARRLIAGFIMSLDPPLDR